jgi:phenylalanyl-tRNA synthetase beta chain
MLFSLSWLRSLCPVREDGGAIAAALTARGLTVDAVEPAGEDVVLDVDVPANRPDCLGHLGLAREISAAFGVELTAAYEPPPGAGRPSDSAVRVEIEEPELCRRFTARVVRGVRVGPSPGWLVERIEACGLRSIDNVVDVSNLVMLETGNPIHFYDLERIAGGTIRVRRGRPAETLVTLDGIERVLDAETLVIADRDRAIGLAGVMGGAATEIGSETRDVLIEAAWFLPAVVRPTARRLGLRTDASHRFERGVDVQGTVRAQSLAARLLVELAGGAPAPGLIDVYPGPVAPRAVTLRGSSVDRSLGCVTEPRQVEQALAAQRLAASPLDGARWSVEIPSWRVDLEREADLVEEVARHLGYDRIPSSTAGLPAVTAGNDREPAARRVRELLALGGLHEAHGYAMIGAGEDDPFVPPSSAPALRLSNPLAEGMSCLRRSLLPGLLRAIDLNVRRGVRDVRLFEVGHVFHARPDAAFPHEEQRVALAWCGAGETRNWSAPPREVDLLDVAGVVEHVLEVLAREARLARRPHELPAFQPGLAVRWETEEGEHAAWAGALHPREVLARELESRVFVAEIALPVLERHRSGPPRYVPLPRQTEVTRDLSVVLEGELSYARILETLERVSAPAPVRFEAVDRYAGPPLAPGQVSLTVRVSLSPAERALTEDEIERYRRGLIEALRDGLRVGIRE